MRQALTLHPDSRCAAVSRIDVDVARPRPGVLTLAYVVTGAIGDLRLPPAAASTRTDELWRHTCFEAFIRSAVTGAYYELNFAPSTEWAAYRFLGVRDGMSIPNQIRAPQIETRGDAESCTLRATVDLGGAALPPDDAPWRLALSAVIEDADGALSYWALSHPPGKPDFHHPDGFTLELPATEGA
jgi:hypothetical protein